MVNKTQSHIAVLAEVKLVSGKSGSLNMPIVILIRGLQDITLVGRPYRDKIAL
ncbi:hypothetical protein [Pantoea sp. Nvir]|uniref:hypothetical protein n=1 Tax=Pantoea sp. Nvir TaxID=2576760 RepID=UPI00135A3789|nr:hypothetical protein [Pantoea sp. Nvir]